MKVPHNMMGGFDKTQAKGSLNDDLHMGRLGVSYMHNPAFGGGAEEETNEPARTPSLEAKEEKAEGDDHAIAHKHLDNARKAKSTDEKRKHVFSALTTLNNAKRKADRIL